MTVTGPPQEPARASYLANLADSRSTGGASLGLVIPARRRFMVAPVPLSGRALRGSAARAALVSWSC